MAKKIFFPLLSLFLVFRTIELVRAILAKPDEVTSFGLALLFSILLNLFATGVFAFVGFAYPSSKLLPPNYYLIKNPLVLTSIYHSLGVPYFKKGLLLFFWAKPKNRKRFFNGTRSGLDSMMFETHQAEFGHLGAFVGLEIISIVLLTDGVYTTGILVTLINIVTNLYPVILQRFHRIRLQRIMRKIER